MGVDLQLNIVDVGMEFGPCLPSTPRLKTGPRTIEETIVNILKDEKAIKTIELTDQVVELTGCTRRGVSYRLTHMKKAGTVIKCPGGYYQIRKDPDVNEPDNPT